MDTMVLTVQMWLNQRYARLYPDRFGEAIPSNGKTGWTTVYALTRALQIELGISKPVNNFGPTTETLYKSWGEMEMGSVPDTEKGKMITMILQGACWCKGYDPGGFEGIFSEKTREAVVRLQTDANLPQKDGKVYAHVFKAFLTMDAYRLTPGGDPKIREIQQQLNNRYYRTSGVSPCDGHYQRQTNKALVYGLQTEMGIPADSQTGTVGPQTRAGLPTLRQGDSGRFVQLLKYAVTFNNENAGTLNTTYTSQLANTISGFQRFVMLDSTGVADKRTWLSLLISTGDPTRKGTACDCVTEVTPARAQTLVDNGYTHVGRYLSNVPDSNLNKKLQPGEFKTIVDAGMSVYPIYQLNGRSADNFSYNQGINAYQDAYKHAVDYGFPKGTTIYFAVDFDVLGHEITGSIVPHFRGLNRAKNFLDDRYSIGIYGPRSACIQVGEERLAKHSFVAGMSTGFSGNLGSPLPRNWSFDQISTIWLGSGAGRIEIDNNINSGRDKGADSVDRKPPKYYSVRSPWADIDEMYTDEQKKVGLYKEYSKSYKMQIGPIRGTLTGKIFFQTPGEEHWDLDKVNSTPGKLIQDELYKQMNKMIKEEIPDMEGSAEADKLIGDVTGGFFGEIVEARASLFDIDEEGIKIMTVEVLRKIAEGVYTLEKFQVEDIKFKDFIDSDVAKVLAAIALLMTIVVVLILTGSAAAPIAAAASAVVFLMTQFFDGNTG